VNGLAQVRQLRSLAGREDDPRIVDMHASARRLESLIANWRTFPPRVATLADAQSTLDGLSQSLSDLRGALHKGFPQ
jgi:hypothetical protein